MRWWRSNVRAPVAMAVGRGSWARVGVGMRGEAEEVSVEIER